MAPHPGHGRSISPPEIKIPSRPHLWDRRACSKLRRETLSPSLRGVTTRRGHTVVSPNGPERAGKGNTIAAFKAWCPPPSGASRPCSSPWMRGVRGHSIERTTAWRSPTPLIRPWKTCWTWTRWRRAKTAAGSMRWEETACPQRMRRPRPFCATERTR